MQNTIRRNALVLLLLVRPSPLAGAVPAIDPTGMYLCSGTMAQKTYSLGLEVRTVGETYELLWNQDGQPTHVGVGVLDRNELAVTFVTKQESAGTALYHVSTNQLDGVWSFVRDPQLETETCLKHGKDA